MELFGYASAALFFLAYLPQLYRTYKLKKVDDISVWMWVLILGAHLTGLTYGVWLDKEPLIVGYLLGLNCTGMMIVMHCLYKDPRPDHARRMAKKIIKDMMRRLKDE